MYLLLHLIVLRQQTLYTLHDVGHVVEQTLYLDDGILLCIEVLLTHLGGDRLDTTNTGSDGALAYNAEGAYATGRVDMGPTTKLDGGAKTDGAYIIPIFLTEESYGTLCFCLCYG